MSEEGKQNYYRRKLFALLHDPPLKPLYKYKNGMGPWEQVSCLYQHRLELGTWWNPSAGKQADFLASASDRATLRGMADAIYADGQTQVEIRHPISGQPRFVKIWGQLTEQQIAAIEDRVLPYDAIRREDDVKKVFWWFWRFYPVEIVNEAGIEETSALLLPADTRIPDCPVHTHNSIVSALAGALYPESWQAGGHEKPYLLIFTFSPVQEFVKSSRKLLDFWAGSYLLHYLSARLCWHVAKKYGPDAVITPSLWDQKIIDAFIAQEYPEFAKYFLDKEESERFKSSTPKEIADYLVDKNYSSLTTAGFPNVITVLVPGKSEAELLGEELTKELNNEWKEVGLKVREAIKKKVMAVATDSLWENLKGEFDRNIHENSQREFLGYKQGGQWEWNKLWDAQLDGSWEHYWTAVPLGDPDKPLSIEKPKKSNSKTPFDPLWIAAQNELSRTRDDLPTLAETGAYPYLNVGTWWGSLQGRLGQLIQSVKNTRNWQLPVAPGERSTVSGLYSAVHPRLLYSESKNRQGQVTDFREGGGLPAESQRLFWRVMAEAFPGLFNGSERLNSIELTKRMAWIHGGVAESLGIRVDKDAEYEQQIRFPNLSSIAAARFAHDNPEKVTEYWNYLNRAIQTELPEYRNKFGSHSRRPFQVPKTDKELGDYNGVMFSSKWLADDLGIQEANHASKTESENKKEKQSILRELVSSAHEKSDMKGWSPSDWWVIVLGDGDNMGKYVNGSRLKTYEHYLATETGEQLKARGGDWEKLLQTKKRMGPATHVGLNRALLDFSNRLVPYLTEERFCGRVVYAGGDDVMAVLPLEDALPYLLSLRAAWSGEKDPLGEFKDEGGYWEPQSVLPGLPNRPLFTMGEGATMSLGVVFAHKSVPLPTVLENLWEAEKERAKKLPQKDGLCFRIIYGSGNTLEALMKGHLYQDWWNFMQLADAEFSPVLYRLSEELTLRCVVTGDLNLFRKASEAILNRREKEMSDELKVQLLNWIEQWEAWAWGAYWKDKDEHKKQPLGVRPEDFAQLLRFSAFWLDKMDKLTSFDPKRTQDAQEGQ